MAGSGIRHIPRRGNSDAANGDRLQVGLTSTRPVFVGHVERRQGEGRVNLESPQRGCRAVSMHGVTKEHQPSLGRFVLLNGERLEVVERRVEQGLDASPVGTWLEPEVDGGVSVSAINQRYL